MKIKTLLSAAAVAMLLGACGGPGEGKSVADLDNPTPADSISNLFGQQYALDFWAEGRADSTMTTPEARKAYLKGVEEALKMSGKDPNYIRGYVLGLSVCQYKENFVKEFDFDFSDKAFLDGLAYGLRSDSTVNTDEMMQTLNMMVTRIGAAKDKKDAAAATANLEALAKKKGYSAMGKDLFGKITVPGQGNTLADGERVEIAMTLTDADGKSLGMPMPTEIVVGRQFKNLPFGTALLKLKPGATGDFATSAFGVFGSRAAQYRLEPSQPLLFSITVKKSLGKEELKSVNKADTPAPDSENSASGAAKK